jgi:hypothetical protein
MTIQMILFVMITCTIGSLIQNERQRIMASSCFMNISNTNNIED